MKRILALVLLCLLLPACALAQVTITDKDGAMVELPYCLEEAQSPYTMTTNGVHSEKVSISVSDNVELVLNGVQIDTADQAALDVIGDVSGSELVLTLAQGTVNTIRSTDTDPEDDAFSSLRTTVPLTIQGKGVLDVQGDGSTIEMANRSNLTIAGGTVKATGVRGIHTNGGVIYIQGGSLTADATGGGRAIGGPVICAPDIVMVGRNNEVDAWRTCDGEIFDCHVRSAEAVELTLMDDEGGTAWTTTVGKGYEFEIDRGAMATPEDKVFVGWKTPDGRTIEYGERLTVHEDTKLEPVFGDPLSVIYEQYQGKPFEESGWVPGMMYVVMPYDGKVPEGQVFSHWLTQDGEKLMEFEPVRLTKSLTLTPVFAEAVEITWLVDDYNVPEVTVLKKGAVCDVIEGIDTEKGVFTGWKVSDVDMTLEAGQRFIADRDLTMIAQFEKKDMVKLTFMDNGIQSAQYMPKGEKNPINKAGEESRGSGEFLYWKDAAGNHYAADELIIPEQDMTLTAEYGYPGPAWISFKVLDTVGGQSYVSGELEGKGMPARNLANSALPDYRMQIVAPDGRTYDQNEMLVLRREHDGGTFKLYWEKLPKPVVIPAPSANLPDTGDSSMPLLWLGLMAASFAGLIAMRARRRA